MKRKLLWSGKILRGKVLAVQPQKPSLGPFRTHVKANHDNAMPIYDLALGDQRQPEPGSPLVR